MGMILDIQRCCYHDGPGIRTTVFFKGCNLRCRWCHNPESFQKEPQLKFIEEQCTNCGQCAAICPHGLHQFKNGVHTIRFKDCTLCNACIRHCPNGALSVFGKEMNPKEVMDIVFQDRSYYEASGGGVTFSGGEATLQQKFLLELLSVAKQSSLHTCLETNGCIPPDYLEQLLPLTDLFLLDYKVTDPAARKLWTEEYGTLWQATLTRLQETEAAVILRLPIIPGINDTTEHFEAAKAFQEKYSVIRSIELLPYHSLGASKWKQIGLEYPLHYLHEPSEEQKERWLHLLNS